ncbi:MAG TPA: AtpZ/AtpI family protein [Chthonomonadaceae bacterium]|nr:AtpZ/AtpI family protein [Chthonomonadaceae bacterium]
MANRDKRDDDPAERFPAPPPSTELPDAPRIEVKLPPKPGTPAAGGPKPGSYRKAAIAATAASTFVTPVLVLGVAGWWLDQRMHTKIGIFAFAGTVLGFIIGVLSLQRVLKQIR